MIHTSRRSLCTHDLFFVSLRLLLLVLFFISFVATLPPAERSLLFLFSTATATPTDYRNTSCDRDVAGVVMTTAQDDYYGRLPAAALYPSYTLFLPPKEVSMMNESLSSFSSSSSSSSSSGTSGLYDPLRHPYHDYLSALFLLSSDDSVLSAAVVVPPRPPSLSLLHQSNGNATCDVGSMYPGGGSSGNRITRVLTPPLLPIRLGGMNASNSNGSNRHQHWCDTNASHRPNLLEQLMQSLSLNESRVGDGLSSASSSANAPPAPRRSALFAHYEPPFHFFAFRLEEVPTGATNDVSTNPACPNATNSTTIQNNILITPAFPPPSRPNQHANDGNNSNTMACNASNASNAWSLHMVLTSRSNSAPAPRLLFSGSFFGSSNATNVSRSSVSSNSSSSAAAVVSPLRGPQPQPPLSDLSGPAIQRLFYHPCQRFSDADFDVTTTTSTAAAGPQNATTPPSPVASPPLAVMRPIRIGYLSTYDEKSSFRPIASAVEDGIRLALWDYEQKLAIAEDNAIIDHQNAALGLRRALVESTARLGAECANAVGGVELCVKGAASAANAPITAAVKARFFEQHLHARAIFLPEIAASNGSAGGGTNQSGSDESVYASAMVGAALSHTQRLRTLRPNNARSRCAGFGVAQVNPLTHIVERRRIEFVVRDHGSDARRVQPIIDALQADPRTAVDVLMMPTRREYIDETFIAARRHELFMLNPVASDRTDFLNRVDDHFALLTPSPEAEMTALLTEAIHRRGLRRLAIMTTDTAYYNSTSRFGADMVPGIRAALLDSGAELVYEFSHTTDLDTIPAHIQAMKQRRVQAFIMYARTNRESLNATTAILNSANGGLDPSVLVLVPFPAAQFMYSILRPKPLRDRHEVILPLYGPLPSASATISLSKLFVDTLKANAAAMKEADAKRSINDTTTEGRPLFASLHNNYSDLDTLRGQVGAFTMLGFATTQLLTAAISAIAPAPVTSDSLQRSILGNTIAEIGGWRVGPVNHQCPSPAARPSIVCGCKSGVRVVETATFDRHTHLVSYGTPLAIPVEACGVAVTTVPSAIFVLLVSINRTAAHPVRSVWGSSLRDQGRRGLLAASPTTTSAASTSSATASASSAATATTGRPVNILEHVITDNFNVSIAAVTDRHLTTVLLAPVVDLDALVPPLQADIVPPLPAPLVDPIALGDPRPYAGFQRSVLYLTPTLDQELHALAHTYGQRGLRLVSASTDKRLVQALQQLLDNSLTTFGFSAALPPLHLEAHRGGGQPLSGSTIDDEAAKGPIATYLDGLVDRSTLFTTSSTWSGSSAVSPDPALTTPPPPALILHTFDEVLTSDEGVPSINSTNAALAAVNRSAALLVRSIFQYLDRFPDALVIIPFAHLRLFYRLLEAEGLAERALQNPQPAPATTPSSNDTDTNSTTTTTTTTPTATTTDPTGGAVARTTASSAAARIHFATSLPNWSSVSPGRNGSTLLAAYHQALEAEAAAATQERSPLASSPPALSTPSTLAAFLAMKLVHNIAERVPTGLDNATFLSALYTVSTVILERGIYDVGPLLDAPCGTMLDGSNLPKPTESSDRPYDHFSPAAMAYAQAPCEVNVGVRVVYIRNLSSVLPPPPPTPLAAVPEGTMKDSPAEPDTRLLATAAPAAYVHDHVGVFLFAAGRIPYRPPPRNKQDSDALAAWAVVLVAVGVTLVTSIAGAAFVALVCRGRSHRHAPQDPSQPFTIVFTDIQSSTALWAESPDAMAAAMAVHHRLIRRLILTHGGYEVKTIGDAFMIAFKRADGAVAFAFALQHALQACKEFGPAIDATYLTRDVFAMEAAERNAQHTTSGAVDPTIHILRHTLSMHLTEPAYRARWNGLRVRVGIHTACGDIVRDDTSGGFDYYGTVVNTAARVEAVAHGGQVLLTEGTLKALESVRLDVLHDPLAVKATTLAAAAAARHETRRLSSASGGHGDDDKDNDNGLEISSFASGYPDTAGTDSAYTPRNVARTPSLQSRSSHASRGSANTPPRHGRHAHADEGPLGASSTDGGEEHHHDDRRGPRLSPRHRKRHGQRRPEAKTGAARVRVPKAAVFLGAVELRGLTDDVPLYQLKTVRGRRFPPLRLDRCVPLLSNDVGGVPSQAFPAPSASDGRRPTASLGTGTTVDDELSSYATPHYSPHTSDVAVQPFLRVVPAGGTGLGSECGEGAIVAIVGMGMDDDGAPGDDSPTNTMANLPPSPGQSLTVGPARPTNIVTQRIETPMIARTTSHERGSGSGAGHPDRPPLSARASGASSPSFLSARSSISGDDPNAAGSAAAASPARDAVPSDAGRPRPSPLPQVSHTNMQGPLVIGRVPLQPLSSSGGVGPSSSRHGRDLPPLHMASAIVTAHAAFKPEERRQHLARLCSAWHVTPVALPPTAAQTPDHRFLVQHICKGDLQVAALVAALVPRLAPIATATLREHQPPNPTATAEPNAPLPHVVLSSSSPTQTGGAGLSSQTGLFCNAAPQRPSGVPAAIARALPPIATPPCPAPPTLAVIVSAPVKDEGEDREHSDDKGENHIKETVKTAKKKKKRHKDKEKKKYSLEFERVKREGRETDTDMVTTAADSSKKEQPDVREDTPAPALQVPTPLRMEAKHSDNIRDGGCSESQPHPHPPADQAERHTINNKSLAPLDSPSSAQAPHFVNEETNVDE